MKIKIKSHALELYIEEHTDFEGNYLGEDYWEQIMERIAGKELEVDTEILFKYEYNTKPIPSLSNESIRIMEDYVEEVVDDVRTGKARCEFCESVSDSTEVCTNCGRDNYLEVF